ncbi:MAG: hypothetical protein EBR30_20480 [Cytophagia bacterium]|nr:hypothetical protein [Cytophagia bacterium]NBW37347.1 hypothetical protein [Cytophagia bacterium]
MSWGYIVGVGGKRYLLLLNEVDIQIYRIKQFITCAHFLNKPVTGYSVMAKRPAELVKAELFDTVNLMVSICT